MRVPTPDDLREEIKAEDQEYVENILEECVRYMKRAVRDGSASVYVAECSLEAFGKAKEQMKDAGWMLTLLSKEMNYDGSCGLSMELKEYVK